MDGGLDSVAEAVNGVEFAQVQRHQRGAPAAVPSNRVVQLLETAHGARDQHELRALGGEAFGDRRSNAARGAGDKCDAAAEPPRGHASSASSDSWAVSSPPS